MSSVMAIERNGIVYMGTDAVKKRCDVKYYVSSEENLNIYKMPNGILVGGVGLTAVSQQMLLHKEWFEIKDGETFDKKHIVTKIIPKLYDVIKDSSAWQEDDYVKTLDISFLIAKGKDMFVISRDLSVRKCEKIACISNEGDDKMLFAFADSYMEQNPSVSPNEVIIRAFDFTSKNDKVVNPCGVLIDTNSFSFQRI